MSPVTAHGCTARRHFAETIALKPGRPIVGKRSRFIVIAFLQLPLALPCLAWFERITLQWIIALRGAVSLLVVF